MPRLEGVTVALTATVTVSLPMSLMLVTALMVDGATTACWADTLFTGL
jgi:hypothetical protein